MNKLNIIFSTYYGCTIGRFYTTEQKGRILRLIALSVGLNASSLEFSSIMEAAVTVDRHNVSDYTESKNFKIMCDLSEESEAVVAAASALVNVYRDIEHGKGPYIYLSERDWRIHLHTSQTKTHDVKTDLGLLCYADGNLKDAMTHLECLVDDGDISAMELLSIISVESRSYEKAYHYFSLMRNVYVKELKVSENDTAWMKKYIDAIEIRIAPEKAEKIKADTDALAALFISKKRGEKRAIGFGGADGRRFSYEA